VVSVLGGGREISIDTSDLSLKQKYSLGAGTQHATTITTLSFARLAAEKNNAGVSFFHTRPGMVKTNGYRELGAVFKSMLGVFIKIFKAWTVPVKDAGERGLWAATSSTFEHGQVHLVAENNERLDNAN
jgi:hypothetical protein